MGKIVLTADRPTGKLHLGHLVGSLENRIKLQEDKNYSKIFIMLADGQALTDNSKNPEIIRDNIIQVLIDYLSVGLDPDIVTFCIQSQLPALSELNFYYLNLVTTARLERNPTVKTEIEIKKFGKEGLPVGFYTYPISQAADITAFHADVVPVGDDQRPMIEQTREIVQKFNSIYGEVLTMPDGLYPKNAKSSRLVGIDGGTKMSKTVGNCIYISEDEKSLKKKVMSMYTDKDHININDPGKIENNVVFTYLDVFCEDRHFSEYFKDYKNLDEMKEHYKRGGLGDVACKNFLFNILNEKISKYRVSRKKWESKIGDIYDIVLNGTKVAIETTERTISEVKSAMNIDFFTDKTKIVKNWEQCLSV